MGFLQPLDAKLRQISSQLPPLPLNARVWLARYAWIICLVGGILTALQAILLLTGSILVSSLYSPYGCGGYGNPNCQSVGTGAGVFLWLAFAAAAVHAVIYLLAFTPLKKFAKAGWDLLLLGVLVWVVEGIFYVFTFDGVGALIGSLVGAIISLYFLYQIRDYFTGTPLPAIVPSVMQQPPAGDPTDPTSTGSQL